MKANARWMPVWRLLTQGAGQQSSVVVSIQVSSDLEHFEGHFVGFGVLPGVVQIDWAACFARQFFSLDSLQCLGMEQIKFQALVLPEAELELHLRWEADKGRVWFAYQQGDKKCSSGYLSWTAQS